MERILLRLFALLLTISTASLSGAPVHAEVVARVLAFSDAGFVQRRGKRIRIAKNLGLESGDRITTDANGEVQIVFVDRTRVLVGANSKFHVQNVKMSSGKKASKFAVRALGGSFRFLSGDSKKETYQIKTPSVTMGIRGTEFDFVVASRAQTRVVAFSGRVQVCNRRNSCAEVVGGCGLTSVVRSRFENPQTEAERLDLLAREFPMVAGQERYTRAFRVQTGSCGDIERAVRAVKAEQKNKKANAVPGATRTRERYKLQGNDDEPAAAPAPAPAPTPAPDPGPTYDEEADES